MSVIPRVTPNVPTVVYDGSCSFCRGWVDRLRKWDRKCRLEYVPLQARRAPGLVGRSREELGRRVHLVLPGGRVLQGAAAVLEALAIGRLGWLIRSLSAIPGVMWIAEAVYSKVAANRYILGDRGSKGPRAKKREL